MRTHTCKIGCAIWTNSGQGAQDGKMSDFRSFAPDLDQEKSILSLSAFESHHLVGTNRARPGDEVVLFNGSGLEWQAKLEIADRHESTLKKISHIQHPKPSLQVTLAIALIKGKTFDTILRQATELGVTQIQPLNTRWTQVRIKDASAKAEKWNQQLIEACKQSGNPWLPKLHHPKQLDQFLESRDFESAVVASLESDADSWKNLTLSSKTTMFVGPEGDFAPEEYQQMKQKGIRPVSLGSNVLRSETAAVSAISILMEAMRQTGD